MERDFFPFPTPFPKGALRLQSSLQASSQLGGGGRGGGAPHSSAEPAETFLPAAAPGGG